MLPSAKTSPAGTAGGLVEWDAASGVRAAPGAGRLPDGSVTAAAVDPREGRIGLGLERRAAVSIAAVDDLTFRTGSPRTG
jgi:hypothetical protein